jgi:teichuronic acid biosynthesis glycosyltransferase TuaG
MPSPTFSVIIPGFNRSELLLRAVRSCLTQTAPPLEIIVVDDAGAEDLCAALGHLKPECKSRGIGLVCIRLAVNGGPAVARNEGWRHARGDYLAFLDSDDVWHPAKLAVIGQALRDSPARCAFHGYATLPDGGKLREKVQAESYRVRRTGMLAGLARNYSQTSCVVLARTVSERFDESMRFVEDHDLWLRVSRHGPLLRVSGPPLTWLGRPLMTAGGLSSNRWRMRQGEIRMYAKFCRHGLWVVALPVLVGWSLGKHVYAELRRRGDGVLGAGRRTGGG